MFRSLLLFLILVLSLSTAGAQVTLTSQEQEIATKLKGSGQKRPFLVLDATLTKVARERAADMARRKYFGHVNPDGIGPNYLIEKAGYKLPDWWGDAKSANYVESIAAGRSSASSTWTDWMNSPSHREHLLASISFHQGSTSYGIGYAADPNSPYRYYWVVLTAPPTVKAPALTIATPAANLRVTTTSLALSGTTSGDKAASSVAFRLENSAGTTAYSSASGTTSWSATAAGLQPGVNTLRVRSLAGDGSVLVEQTRAVTFVEMAPLTVAINGGATGSNSIAGLGKGVVTAGYLGTTSRELGRAYTITATPAADSLFAGWSGGSSSTSGTLTFTMARNLALTANFVPNPFFTKVGTYTGVVNGTRAGWLTVTLTKTGYFTGSIRVDGVVHPLRGTLAADGATTLAIARPGLAPLSVTLQLDLATEGGVAATVAENGTTIATATGSLPYSTAKGLFPAGFYTVVLPAGPSLPAGHGNATLTVTTAGTTRLVGSLADGTFFDIPGAFSRGHVLSFHLALYGGKGEMAGTLALRPTDVTDLDGSFRWVKPAQAAGTTPFADAIATTCPLIGAKYTPPAAGKPMLPFTAATFQFGAGQLATPVDQSGRVAATNALTLTLPLALPGVRLALLPASGCFSGSFTHPVTKVVSNFRGVYLPKQGAGFGFFHGKGYSGYITLRPTPVAQ